MEKLLLESENKIRGMEERGKFLLMEVDMRGNMKVIIETERVLIIGEMEGRKLGNGKMG
jgi:hypothetical protein